MTMRLWTPADLATAPVGWWDASSSSTLTFNGSKVSAWANKGSAGGSLSQATASSQPTYSATGLGGSYPTISFANTPFLGGAISGLLNQTTAAAFIVGFSTGTGTSGGAYVSATASSSSNDYSSAAAFRVYDDSGPAVGSIRNGNFLTSTASVVANTPFLFDEVFDGTNAVSFLNGTQKSSNGSTGTFGVNYLQLGKSVVSNETLGGAQSEIILLNYNPSTADRQKIEGYQAWKWGLQTSSGGVLPAGHPYYSAAPTVTILNDLTITPTTATAGSLYTGTLSGCTSGSTVTVASSDGTTLTVSGTGTTRTFTGTFASAGTPSLTPTETLSTATNSPHTSPATTITVSSSGGSTTVNYAISQNSDDAYDASGTFTDNNNVLHGVGSGTTYSPGFRFQNVAIPQGASITSATLTVINGSGGFGDTSGVVGKIYGIAADNVATFSSGNNPASLTGTTASTSVSATALNSTININVTAQAQAIVNRSGWASGNAMGFKGDASGGGGAFNSYYAYNSSPTNAAKLSITYTAGGSSSVSLSGGSVTGTGGSLSFSASSVLALSHGSVSATGGSLAFASISGLSLSHGVVSANGGSLSFANIAPGTITLSAGHLVASGGSLSFIAQLPFILSGSNVLSVGGHMTFSQHGAIHPRAVFTTIPKVVFTPKVTQV